METSKITTTESHPCFDREAGRMNARVHLPVAPKCNIQCNYCNRKYDCVNESRPGVTSGVLSPHQALSYLKKLHDHIPNIAVVGIAGPGDPFANPEETMRTLQLVREEYPDKIFCISTNGLNIIPYIPALKAFGVTHVTITMNAVDPAIGKDIYSWVRTNKKVYRGYDAAKLLLEEQVTAIILLKKQNITVKINSIILPGINDRHFEEIAARVKGLGADIMNCIPVYPNADTVFSEIEKPKTELIHSIRNTASLHMKLMTHCARCRADAAGLLGADFSGTFGMIREFASQPLNPEDYRPYVAVATNEGLLVNMHLGEASALNIYKQTPNGFQFVETRSTPKAGGGNFRWIGLANSLKDCRALLTAGIGPNPLEILQKSGLRVIQMTGIIDEGLEAIYNNKPLRTVNKKDMQRCGSGCKGNAQGCA
jgi:nitrogen fixation protein NifB